MTLVSACEKFMLKNVYFTTEHCVKETYQVLTLRLCVTVAQMLMESNNT